MAEQAQAETNCDLYDIIQSQTPCPHCRGTLFRKYMEDGAEECIRCKSLRPNDSPNLTYTQR
jgi:hypothetical protein